MSIPDNEMADTLVNAATISEYTPKPVPLAAVSACIKRTIKDGAPLHPRVAAVYSKLTRRKDQEAIKTRKDAITLARLRFGHHAAFGAYRNLIDPQSTLCAENIAARFELFGWTVTTLGILMALVVKTLRQQSPLTPVHMQ